MFISPKSTCLKRICIYDLSLYVFCAFLFWPIMFTDLYVWNIFASVFSFSVLSTCCSNKKQYFYKEKEGKYGCFFERFLRQLNRHSLYPSCSLCVWFWGQNTGFCPHKGPHWATHTLSLYAFKCNKYCSKPATIPSQLLFRRQMMYFSTKKKEQRKSIHSFNCFKY